MSGVMIPVVVRLQALHVPPAITFLFEVNPATVYLNIMRDCLMGTYDSAWGTWNWLAAVAWAAVTLPFGVWFFWRAEGSYGRG